MKAKVFVFPCGSEIGLELHRALKWTPHIELIGGSSVASNHGKYVYDNYIEGIPAVDDSDFIDAICEIVKTHKIDFIYPAHDSVVLELTRNEDRIGAKIIGSIFKTNEICRSKSRTYSYFEGILKVPRVFNSQNNNFNSNLSIIEDYKFPLFLKPDVGQGSKGTYKVSNIEELRYYCSCQKNLLILEYLPGKEYTVDCFTDRHGRLRFAGARERVRISNGISVDTKPVKNSVFREIASLINSSIRLRGGVVFSG